LVSSFILLPSSAPFTALPAFVPHLATSFRSLRRCWL
jgi:hypothetical protein